LNVGYFIIFSAAPPVPKQAPAFAGDKSKCSALQS